MAYNEAILKEVLDREFNDVLLDLYPLSVANGSMDAGAQRELGEAIARHIGESKIRTLRALLTVTPF